MNEHALFLAALDKEPQERGPFLDQSCADDPDLRRRLEALLRSHDLAGEFLQTPVLEQATVPEETPVCLDPTLVTGETQKHDNSLSFLLPSSRSDSIGRIGHYEVLELVGRGGMGMVLRAFDEKLHRVVALKVLSRELAASPQARKRFIREAIAAAQVSHENVVHIHAVEDEGPVPYLVMQFVQGKSLDDRLREEGSLDVKEIVRIGVQIAHGLAAAHKQGLIHRDIKPANILLENGVQRVKITDFGLARAVDDATITQTGVIAGTPQYMSPEQAQDAPIDHRSDLFSLGSLMYAMCVGRPPFRASTTVAVLRRVCDDAPRPIEELNPEIPEWLCEVINKLLAKRPSERYQSAREVAEVLERQLAELLHPAKSSACGPMGAAAAPCKPALPEECCDSAATLPAASAVTPAMAANDLGKKRRWPLVAACGILGAAILAGIIVINTNRGQFVIETDDPDFSFRVTPAGVKLEDRKTKREYELKVARHDPKTGEYELEVTDEAAGLGFTTRTLTIKRGEKVALKAWLQGGGAPAAATATEAQLAGMWDGGDRDWGQIRIVPAREGYTGSYSATYNGLPGSLAFKPLGDRGYRGEWWESDRKRHGSLLLLPTDSDTLLVQWEVFDADGVQPTQGNSVWRRAAGSQYDWVQLFNGKDLSGWKQHPDQPGHWHVKNGVLVGTGPGSHLFTERGDYEDFHLRVEAKINDAANGGVWFRTGFALPRRLEGGLSVPDGYEADILTITDGWKTGSLTRLQPYQVDLIKPDEWFTLEVTAQGGQIEIRVNGTRTVSYADRPSSYAQGHIALQALFDKSVLEFRKIEIKELARMAMPYTGLVDFRSHLGKTLYFEVTGSRQGAVYGTDVYTDDSTLSAAAVHAGALKEGERGVVKVTVLPGQNHYASSVRNGVASYDWGPFAGSYRVERAPPGIPVASDPVGAIVADSTEIWMSRGQIGKKLLLRTTGRTSGPVWGIDIYTDDSDLGTAAVHAGVLRAGEPGLVKVTILEGRASYPGIARNGVTSSPYGQWGGSYRIEPAAAPPHSIAGVWEDAHKGVLTFEHEPLEGRRPVAVSGAWDSRPHSPYFGTFPVGQYDPATRTLKVEFFDDSSKQPGQAEFTLSEDGRMLSGSYLYSRSNHKAAWNLTLKESRPAWGRLIDPSGACTLTRDAASATFRIPGDRPFDLLPPPAYGAGYNRDAPRLVQEVEGDFTMRVIVPPFERPRPGTTTRPGGKYAYRSAGLLVWAGDVNFLRFERASLGETNEGAPYLHAQWFLNGNVGGDQNQGFLDGPDRPTHLQIERRGTRLHLRYSHDGTTWTDWPSVVDFPLGARTTVGLTASNSARGEHAPRFENFQVVAASRSTLPDAPPDAASPASIAGAWDDQFGGVVIFAHGPLAGSERVAISGDWFDARSFGQITGGHYDPALRTLAFSFTDAKIRGAGRANFVVSENGQVISGTYTYANGFTNAWMLRRRMPGDYAQPFAGVYDSEFGPVTLKHDSIHAGQPVPVTGSWDGRPASYGKFTQAMFDPTEGTLALDYLDEAINLRGSAKLWRVEGGQVFRGTYTNNSQSDLWTLRLKNLAPVTWREAMARYTWPIGSTLTVSLIDETPNPEMEKLAREIAAEWSTCANLNFEFFGPDPKAHVRLTFDSRLLPPEAQSANELAALGTAGLDRNQFPVWSAFVRPDPDAEVVAGRLRHVFGHVLGLIHEDQRVGYPWDEEKVYAHHAKASNWSREETFEKVLKRKHLLEHSPLDRFDPLSVMANPFGAPAGLLKDGITLQVNRTLSDQDKRLVSELYPGRWSDGSWQPLFNGKDLAGWKPAANWTVRDGLLCSVVGQSNTSLRSRREDFADFHLRAEARINDRGNSGIWFRSPAGWRADVYEAQINSTHADPIKTGSLWNLGEERAVKQSPPAPGEWFTLEVVAIDNSITVKVNGAVTAQWVDPDSKYQSGAIVLQQYTPQTEVEFRKIEIQELSGGVPVSDKARLQGKWRLVSAEHQGKPVPVAELKDADWIEFSGESQTTNYKGKIWKGAYRYNALPQPGHLDLVSNEYATVQALYRIEGDKLTIAQGEPGDPRPESFATTPQTKHAVYLYQRAAASADQSPANIATNSEPASSNPSSNSPAALPVDFNGVWNSSWGEVTFKHAPAEGDKPFELEGSYYRGTASIKGTVDPKTRTMTGTFQETTTRGKIRLVLSADNSCIEGHYGFQGPMQDDPIDTYAWPMTRKTP